MADTTLWKKVRSEFPAVEEPVYFNAAAITPLSTKAGEAVAEVTDAFVREGILCEERVMARAREVRELAASMIGATGREIAFTKNTTQGVLLAARGIRWKSGDNVVMPGIEFPANVYPWMSLMDQGVEIRMVEPEEGRVTAEMLSDVCDHRTRAITASYVQFSTGYRIDCAELGSFCRDKGILLHIDAIQALGAIDVDVRRDKIDLLSCGGHKWMLATPGIGLFYCRQDLLEKLDVPNPGWTGVVDYMDFLDYDYRYRDEASRYEEGSLNFQGIYALGTAVERFLSIGTGAVETRVIGLASMLAGGLVQRGYEVTSPGGNGERSGIICFRHPGGETAGLFGKLAGKHVICSLRGDAVRLSPHIYNDESDIERFFNVLEVC